MIGYVSASSAIWRSRRANHYVSLKVAQYSEEHIPRATTVLLTPQSPPIASLNTPFVVVKTEPTDPSGSGLDRGSRPPSFREKAITASDSDDDEGESDASTPPVGQQTPLSPAPQARVSWFPFPADW